MLKILSAVFVAFALLSQPAFAQVGKTVEALRRLPGTPPT